MPVRMPTASTTARRRSWASAGAQRGPGQPAEPLVLKLRVAGEEPISLSNVELLAYRHEYDIRNAVVPAQAALPRPRGPRVVADQPPVRERMNRMHQAALAWDVVPENWSGRLEIVTAIDGRITNHGVARYRQLEGGTWTPRRRASSTSTRSR